MSGLLHHLLQEDLEEDEDDPYRSGPFSNQKKKGRLNEVIVLNSL